MAAVSLSGLAANGGVRAEEPPTAAIVFDGSGSIWGRIEGTKAAKLDVAREAVRAALSDAPATAAVGLVSYGHRRRGDCSDIEVIVPPEAGSSERIGAALDKLNPRGKGPITLAVREAARQIGGRRPASIVLVTDNADNCRADFCEMGEELTKSQPGLAVHIVGVALEPDEAPRIQCVAKATGGRFFDSRDADQLTANLVEVLRLALRTSQQQPSAVSEPQLQSPPQRVVRPPPPPGKPSLAALASLGDDGPEIQRPIHWRLLSEDGSATLLSATAPMLDEALAPGRYVVEAETGGISARRTIEVTPAGPAKLRVPLPAGTLKVALGALKDTTEPVLVTVFPEGASAPGRPLLVSREPDTELLLPPGAYRIRAEQGQAAAEQRVVIETGKAAKAELPLAAARLELTATAAGDGPPVEGSTFVIAAEESGGSWREIARTGAKAPLFVLPAGTYRVTARLGQAEAHQRIVLVAGETARRALVLSLARLKLSAALPAAASAAPLTFKVARLEGDAGDSVETSVAKPELPLAAGRYRVEAQAGAQNVRTEATIALTAGRDAQQELRLAAAAVTLRLAELVAPGPGVDVYWEVRDAAGRVVWRTSSPEPRGFLAPGRYSLRVESRDKSLERTFDLASGEARTIEVGGN